MTTRTMVRLTLALLVLLIASLAALGELEHGWLAAMAAFVVVAMGIAFAIAFLRVVFEL